MKLYLKQKVFSWRDKFFVKDETNTDRYYVQGEILSIGKKLHVYDMGGSEVAFVRQKILTALPKYYIEIGGVVVAVLSKKLSLLKPKYFIEGVNWELRGDFLAHDYTLTEAGNLVMQMSKAYFSWGDSYEMNIAQPQHELMCLCIALAVDADLTGNRSNTQLVGIFD
ncbi:MAG: hypothetical protein FWG45_05070 [Oscillospiraceae bacterium]|nr:hypothetical protein [Oscillospiraceae bacterium]